MASAAALADAVALIASMKKMLERSIEFHDDVDEDSDGEDDVRFLWEVRIVRGKNKKFGRVSGSSTMPGLLADSQLHLIVDRVSEEMISKIAGPVSGKFQDLANRKALEFLAVDSPMSSKPTRKALPSMDKDLAMEAEIISQQGKGM